MDGKRRKEIKKYALVFLAVALCITAASAGFARYEERLRRDQIAELAGKYPEMEADLIRILEKDYKEEEQGKTESEETEARQKQEILERMEDTYGYHYERSVSAHRIWMLWGACMAVMAAAFTMLWTASGRRAVIRETEAEEEQMKLLESLREAQNRIEDLKEIYEKEEEDTKALITNISHQLKTPLSSLRMSHELLASDYLTESEKQEFLLQEGTEINKLQMLLDEMIKASRLEKHMIALKPERQSLRDTVSEAVSVVYPKAVAKRIHIQVEMEEDAYIIHDARWTAEAFANILDNGVKYAPEDTEIKISVKEIGQNILLEFMDEGCGIPDDEKHKIYQRFYRGTNSQGTEGAGVGLFLARQILEEQGGSVMVRNRYPKGSVFRVLMPF